MTRLDACKGFLADLARPFAIWSSSGAAAIATVRIAWVGEHFEGAAIFIGAVWAGVGALYIGKAWENKEGSKHGAQVAIEQARAATPTATTVTAPADATVTVEPAGDGELPPSQRINP